MGTHLLGSPQIRQCAEGLPHFSCPKAPRDRFINITQILQMSKLGFTAVKETTECPSVGPWLERPPPTHTLPLPSLLSWAVPCPPRKFTCCSLNPQDLRMWLHLERGSLKTYYLKVRKTVTSRRVR